jgi:hypothetical protein
MLRTQLVNGYRHREQPTNLTAHGVHILALGFAVTEQLLNAQICAVTGVS